ncbi:hypothetical protein DICPUDRAFT_148101 [Dictyostelium purpureum]|uniref:Dephospho-CoA kinase n=1 Tax=Dictyostelium purpureum TaxID=5786 RepID=F0ZA91_DICPU|nr:uncharacterized protein DICPUDRAFT_148101 [Dictyostelium purpureum]EGC39192.1 hypothetical protein DICPUDRAFT_148101 [Dictyostelium purpureum]|eukprot:XP_003284338.1 hypothetical protein DICPUDRAFT_148101 [Dictyostelium purpureum]
MSKLIKIGLTGGIASGKSTILGYLKELNIKCIDADKIGHSCYQKGRPSYYKIIQEFGEDIVNKNDESIDRAKLGPIVFSDPNKMKALTNIVWPEMRDIISQEFKEMEEANQDRIVVLEAAVLIEGGFLNLVDRVWVTSVPREVAIERIVKRNNLSETDAAKRIDSQLTNEERAKYANVVFHTNDEYSVTKNKVINEIKSLLEDTNNSSNQNN